MLQCVLIQHVRGYIASSMEADIYMLVLIKHAFLCLFVGGGLLIE